MINKWYFYYVDEKNIDNIAVFVICPSFKNAEEVIDDAIHKIFPTARISFDENKNSDYKMNIEIRVYNNKLVCNYVIRNKGRIIEEDSFQC
ncbi:MAG TPA: hypothetical protein GXX35_04445 [Thermoanaerobacterales bacterium]|nr:hypothetical protein [Thermoanaerobacterales bacterium]